MRRLAWCGCFAVIVWATGCGGSDAPHVPTGRYASKASALSTGTGLQGQYFDTLDFSDLKTTRVDPTVDFDWGSGMPSGVALTDQYTFSVRWTGQVEAAADGTYTFTVGSDDGCRLWVNGQLLIADWTLHAYTENSATISLAAGERYDIKLEFYENLGVASVKLYWAFPGQAKQIVPAVRLYPPADPPVLVAPPLDQTTVTSVPDSTAFIYSSPTPVQTGVDAGTIQKERVSAIRGRVLTTAGQPAVGVTVSVLGHPEFGQTLSRTDGIYDLVVNGGAPVTLSFTQDGYPTVHRQVATPWREFVSVPDAVLTALDSSVSILSADAESMQVARGSVATDDAGTRRATIMLPAHTTAVATLPDGGTQTLTSMHIRATEYTVGAVGEQAMPATLPPRSGYTYAVELSVDEALAQGAENVQFNNAFPSMSTIS